MVCSFQSGMQTVRASFTVPGSDGVAAAVENDPFEPDDRLGREQRHMRFVDKSALVLKEHAPLEPIAPAARTQSLESDESIALVQEVTDAANSSSESSVANELLTVDNTDVPNSVAMLEDIVPGINEQHIKHENAMLKLQEIDEQHEDDGAPKVPVMAARAAKYAKLVREQAVANLLADETNTSGTMSVEQWYHLHNTVEGRGECLLFLRRLMNYIVSIYLQSGVITILLNIFCVCYLRLVSGFATTLERISANAGSIIITVSLCVIVLGIFVFVVFREARRQRFIRSNIKMQQLHSSRASSSTSLSASKPQPGKRTMPRALQAQLPQGSM